MGSSVRVSRRTPNFKDGDSEKDFYLITYFGEAVLRGNCENRQQPFVNWGGMSIRDPSFRRNKTLNSRTLYVSTLWRGGTPAVYPARWIFGHARSTRSTRKLQSKKYPTPCGREVADHFTPSHLPEYICRNWHLRHRRPFISRYRVAGASQGRSLRLSGREFSYSIVMRESSRGRELRQFSRQAAKTRGTP